MRCPPWKPPFFLLFFCSPLFGNCPFFFLLSSPGFRFFLYFYLFRRLFFLSAGFFLLPLQITDIFLCLFFDAPLGGGIKLPVFFFLLFGGAGASGSDCGGADAITLEGSAIFSAFRCFFVFGSLKRGFLRGFPSGRLSDLQITLRFTTKRRAFIKKAVMLSPPIPIRLPLPLEVRSCRE